ncbi:MAG: hypothetical protein PQJ60_05430, partial [Spirochaetales bacterium]|nr:hypothetical protein [Spirochaetales bacterium]
MKRTFFIIIIFFIVFNIYTQSTHVLFLSSYHPNFPTYHRQREGIKSAFPPGEIVLDEEFMDSKRLGWEGNGESFFQRLSFKEEGLPPYDIVITGDDNAFVFMQRYGEELFPGTPFVFMGVNNRENGLSEESNPRSTGVLEIVSFRKTMELIKSQFPQAKEVLVISDGTPSGQADLASLKEQMEENPPLPIKVLNMEEYSFEEAELYLSSLSKETPLLLLSAYTDREGVTLDFDESFDQLYRGAQGPIYHLWEHGFGRGALGGYVVDHYNQGQKAGE